MWLLKLFQGWLLNMQLALQEKVVVIEEMVVEDLIGISPFLKISVVFSLNIKISVS